MTQAQVGTTQAEPTSDRNRWVALYVLCISVLMIVLDVTVVNVALPSIKDDLGFSQSSLAWVVNAYLITFGGLLLLAGRLGDLIGRRTILLYGLALFVIASVLCGLSQSEVMLIGARLLQGIGAAMTSAGESPLDTSSVQTSSTQSGRVSSTPPSVRRIMNA